MKFNPKIVPFDRGADFVYQRAMKNRRDNNILEALDLMRKAVESSPENEAYKLELAELLSEAGCRERSNRLLLDMLSQGVKYDECLYALAINQLNDNNPESAKRLLDMCMATEGEVKERASALTGEIEMFETLNRPATRAQERLIYLTNEACNRLRCDEYSGAHRLFERALAIDPTQRDVRALLAMTFMLIGKRDDAMREAQASVSPPGVTIRSLCVAAQVYYMAGESALAARAMERAAEMDGDELESRMLIFTYYELGMYFEARELARKALRYEPYDRQLIHAAAVCAIKCGESLETAAKIWQRITRIDPADSIARYYSDAALAGLLDENALNCEYQVPRDEQIARFKYIAGMLDGDIDKLSGEWRRDARFRDALTWCLSSDNARFREASVTLLSSIDDPEAESLLREFMLRPGTGFDMTLRAVAMYRMRGVDLKKIVPPYSENGGLMPDAEMILARMSVFQRQIVRYADEVLRADYSINDIDRLALIWDMYLRQTPLRNNPLTNSQTAAAALAYCYLLLDGKPRDIDKLAQQFECSRRQLAFFSSRLVSTMENAVSLKDDGGENG